MGAGANGNGRIHPVATHHIVSYNAADLREVVQFIIERRLNGSLEINFSEGHPAGMLKWREKISAANDNTSKNFP